jgi:hypothetical protein
MRVALAIAALLAACSFPEKELVDGNGPPFGCINAPAPTSATNPAEVSGKVVQAVMGTPIPNVSVAGKLAGNSASIFVATTGANGEFKQSQNTGGTPLDLSLLVSANGYSPTHYYPAYLFTHDMRYPTGGPEMSAIQLFNQQARGTVETASGITLDPNKGYIILNLEDCNGDPLSGGTVSSSPAGTIIYFNGVTPSPQLTSTGSLGVAMIANLPPGNVTVTSMARGMSLKTKNMMVDANTFIQVEIGP